MSSDEDSKPVEIPWRKRSLEDREQMTKKRPHKNTEKTETEEDPTSDKNESEHDKPASFNVSHLIKICTTLNLSDSIQTEIKERLYSVYINQGFTSFNYNICAASVFNRCCNDPAIQQIELKDAQKFTKLMKLTHKLSTSLKKLGEVDYRFFKEEDFGDGVAGFLDSFCGKLNIDANVCKQFYSLNKSLLPSSRKYQTLAAGIIQFVVNYTNRKRKCEFKIKLVEKDLLAVSGITKSTLNSVYEEIHRTAKIEFPSTS